MYQSHFNFKNPPFRKVTRASGDFFVPYHQDIFNLLKEKTRQAGITGLFCDDAALLFQYSDALKSNGHDVLSINAFPKLSASSLLYKLNPESKESKTRLHAVDAMLRQWQEAPAFRKAKSKVLVISHVEAMKDNCRDVLGMLLARAQEMAFPLSIMLMGPVDQEKVLIHKSGLQEYVHTHHVVRSLTRREMLNYVHAQCEEQGCETSPLAPARVIKMHELTKGHLSKFNELAHLSMLAAWTERASCVGPRHLRLAAGEILPAKSYGKRLATVGVLASTIFAACGWYLTGSINARLPFQLPVPVSWQQQTPKTQAPVVPVINNEIVNQPDAMHQLYVMWGYDASVEDALCQNAAKVNLMCKQGTAPLAELAKEGYPWISEIKTGDHLNYAVVARVGNESLDLLMNNRTWQVSRSWFNQHATGHYTQLHRLTPQGKDVISATSNSKDLTWLDQQLSIALAKPETHAQNWTAEMMKRTREFQQRMNLHVDGIPGEDTLMQLMRETNTTPSVLIQTSHATNDASTQEKHS